MRQRGKGVTKYNKSHRTTRSDSSTEREDDEELLVKSTNSKMADRRREKSSFICRTLSILFAAVCECARFLGLTRDCNAADEDVRMPSRTTWRKRRRRHGDASSDNKSGHQRSTEVPMEAKQKKFCLRTLFIALLSFIVEQYWARERSVDVQAPLSTRKKEAAQAPCKRWPAPSASSWERGAYRRGPLPRPPLLTRVLVRFSFVVKIACARISDFFRARGLIFGAAAQERPEMKDFAPIETDFNALYVNNIYRHASDVCNRPVAGVVATTVPLKERETRDNGWTYHYTGRTDEVINLGSYNYLGFSQSEGPCADEAAAFIDSFGIHVDGTRHSGGNHRIIIELEREIARYLGVEDVITYPMGFGSNAMAIPTLADEDTLVLSDEVNHASMCFGCRTACVTVITFKHNNVRDAEEKLRQAILRGNHKRNGAPFKKVIVAIEGIYSMEGSIVDLPGFVALKKKYGLYLYIDEAHSIGALGPTGRGIVEYWGLDPRDVDCLMGTLTKSFAGSGGYIGGSKRTIDFLRSRGIGACYGAVLSPAVIGQVVGAMRIMTGADGTRIGQWKRDQLRRNTRYFRRRLEAMGFRLAGHDDSPVVPLMTYFLTKVVAFGRETLRRGVATISVGFPATPLTEARARFCLSAEHTREQIDQVLKVLDDVGDITGTKYGRKEPNNVVIEY